MAHLTMVFWTEEPSPPSLTQANLEYSWVPTGQRKDILLGPGVDEGARVDEVKDSVVSKVQIYNLNGRDMGGSCIFPDGPPWPSPVIHASVEVWARKRAFRGTVHYADGTSASRLFAM